MGAGAHEHGRRRPPVASHVSLGGNPLRHTAGEYFLKGPVPWSWLARAGRLSGHALHVGIVLWWKHGITGDAVFSVPMVRLREMGVGRHSLYRALDELAAAGLIEVERHRGRAARVRLVPAPRDAAAGKAPCDLEGDGGVQ